jgi:hypothetical protein
MKPRDALEAEARIHREIAARVRRLARGLSLNEDRLRIDRFANELVGRAAELEAAADALRRGP